MVVLKKPGYNDARVRIRLAADATIDQKLSPAVPRRSKPAAPRDDLDPYAD